MIELLALDVDGTITDDDGCISAENISAVKYALTEGIQVAIATGRTKQGVIRIKEKLGLADETPLILANGALVLAGGDIWLEDYMDPSDVKAVADYAGKLGNVVITAFNPDEAHYFTPPTIDRDWVAEKLDSFDFTKRRKIDRLRDLPDESVSKMMFIATDPSIADAAFAHWPKELQHLKLGHSYPYLCEINKSGVEKGRGLELVCDKLGIDPSRVLAIGDGGTDIPLFELSGHAVFIQRTDAIPPLPEHVIVAPVEHMNTGISWALDELIHRSGA